MIGKLSVALAATNPLSTAAIIAYVIPWLISIALVIVGLVWTLKRTKVNPTTLIAIGKALYSNDLIKEAINAACVDIATRCSNQNVTDLPSAYSEVTKYVGSYLLSIYNKADSTLENTEAANEIYSVLDKYKITLDNINTISDYIIRSLGYDDITIRNMVNKEIQNLDILNKKTDTED